MGRVKKNKFRQKNNMDFLMKIFEIKDQTITISEEIDENNPIQIKPSYSLFDHQINVLFEIEKILKKPIKMSIASHTNRVRQNENSDEFDL